MSSWITFIVFGVLGVLSLALFLVTPFWLFGVAAGTTTAEVDFLEDGISPTLVAILTIATPYVILLVLWVLAILLTRRLERRRLRARHGRA